MSKERVNVLLCCNGDGSKKLIPLVIGRAKNRVDSKTIKLFRKVTKLTENRYFSRLCVVTGNKISRRTVK